MVIAFGTVLASCLRAKIYVYLLVSTIWNLRLPVPPNRFHDSIIEFPDLQNMGVAVLILQLEIALGSSLTPHSASCT